jgi:hypothetical protein
MISNELVTASFFFYSFHFTAFDRAASTPSTFSEVPEDFTEDVFSSPSMGNIASWFFI